MSVPRAQTSDELETVEAQNSLFDLLYDGSARAATTGLGQFVYRRVDSLLSIVEKTARWSLPQVSLIEFPVDDPNKINISAPPLIRPLPWVLFLPALIALRLIRVALSFLALMLGKPPVYPVTIVAFLQNKRRKLRALKYRGQRLIRITRAEAQALEDPLPTWLSRVILPFRTVVSLKTFSQQSSKVTANHSQHNPAKKRNTAERDFEDSDDSFEDADCMDLLKKYGDIDADSTFNAAEVSSESSDSSISEAENSASEAETTQDAPESVLHLETSMNGHKDPAKSIDALVQAANIIAKEAEKPQEKSSLNVSKVLNTDIPPASPLVEKAEEAIAENGSSDPASDKQQDTKKKTTIPPAKTTIAAVAPEAVTPNSLSRNNSSNKAPSVSVGGETKSSLQQQQQQQPHHKIKQQLPANLQSQNNQQPQTVTANGGSGGGRKQKKPNQTHC